MSHSSNEPSREAQPPPGDAAPGEMSGSTSSTSDPTRALFQDLMTVRARPRRARRPFVTLSYAQSLDGCITTERGQRYRLSGPEAMRFTHVLRAAHDAILVGVGTVLADDPELRVRLVDGPDPQPIVVDSSLRTPGAAKLLAQSGRRAWIATVVPPAAAPGAEADGASLEALRRARLAHVEARGARILRCRALPNGWVDLETLLDHLAAEGVAHVMVEGGARIITSLVTARLVDYLIVTVVPQLLGGLPALALADRPAGLGAIARVERWVETRVGGDLLLGGELSWPAP